MVPLFNGTPEAVKKWIEENETDDTMLVCVGKTLDVVSIKEYQKK